MSFGDVLRARGTASLAAFGDSITVGVGVSDPAAAWPWRLAAAAGVPVLRNKGKSGSVLQGSPLAGGRARPGNGVGRYRRDLLGSDRCEAIAILYGYNDARYTAAPETFGLDGFVRDYRRVVAGLLDAGIDPSLLCLGSPPWPTAAGLGRGSPGFTGQTRAGFEAFVAAVRDLAAEFGLAYAPVYEAMQATGGGALASADIVHPGDPGHAVIAGAFFSGS